MSHLFKHERIYVYCRIDDIYDWTPAVKKLLLLLIRKNFPVNLQIIPARVTKECINNLRDFKNKYPSLISFGQHGFSHENYGDIYCYEFGPKRTYRQQYNDIVRGYLILKRIFGDHFFEVFTPPYNTFNEHTLDICNRVGYKVFSQGGCSYLGKYNFVDISPQIDIVDDYLQKKLKSLEELTFQFNMLYFKTSIIGILIHPEILAPNGFHILGKFIDYIKQLDSVEFVSFEDLWSLVKEYEGPSTDKPLDVLLVSPSYRPHWSDCVPTGLIELGTFIKSQGYTCEILDLNLLELDQREAVEYILLRHPRVVGISCITRQALRGYEIGRNIKKIDLNIKIVYGGVHPTALPEEPFELGAADYVVRREGEITFSKLLDFLLKGMGDVSKIDGLSYISEGIIYHNKDQEFIKNLDIIPMKDWSLVEPRAYDSDFHLEHEPYKSITLMTSRGCTGDCIYCNSPQLYKRRVRYYSVDRVIDEIRNLVENFGITQIHFHDDNFMLNRKRLKDLCTQIIAQKLPIKWICLSDVRSIIRQKDLLPLMREAGCIGIEIGMETASPLVLKYMRKNYLFEEQKKAISLLKHHKITPFILLMNYFPGENVDSPYYTLRYFYELIVGKLDDEQIPDPPWDGLYLWSHLTRVSPGCEMYEHLDRYGINLARSWDDHYEERINFLPYSFLNDIVIQKQNLTKEEALETIHKRRSLILHLANNNFYCYREYIESIMPFDKFLLFMADIYSMCNDKTVNEICLKVSPKYGEMTGITACAISMLSILRLICSKNNEEVSQNAH